MDHNGLIVETTSSCCNNCRFCIMQHWIKSNRGWEMTPGNVHNLLLSIKNDNIQRVYLTGGDPLLWSHLDYGVELFASHGIDVIINTSGVPDGEDAIIRLGSLVKKWIITLYDFNFNQVKSLDKYTNVEFSNTVHWDFLYEDNPSALPADCMCGEPVVMGDVAYACNELMTMGTSDYNGHLSIPFGGKVPVKEGFLSELLKDKFNMDACKRCIANVNNRIGQPNKILNNGV